MDKNGKCYLELKDLQLSSKTCKCSLICKKFCVKDRQIVLNLIKSVFTDESVEEVTDLLQNLDDGCEHGHYSKRYDVDMEESSNKSSHLNHCKEL